VTTFSEEKRLEALKISEYVTRLLKEEDNYFRAANAISGNEEEAFRNKCRDVGIPEELIPKLWKSFREDEFTAQFW
jgi:hypothetical protein